MANNRLTHIQQLVASRRAKQNVASKSKSYTDSPEFKKVKMEFLNFLATYKVSKATESNNI